MKASVSMPIGQAIARIVRPPTVTLPSGPSAPSICVVT